MAQIAGNLQRIKNGQRRYAITPRIPAGFIQPDQLQKYIDVANKFGAVLKLTGSQRIMITNLKAEDVDAAWEMLGMEPAYMVSNRVRSVKICPGTTFCKRAKQDSVHLGMQLERKYLSQEMPSKMKIGVSGCINSCTESRMKDVGVIGSVEGWSVYAGGSGGAHPRIGDLIAEVTTEKEALALVDRIIEYYKANAQIERMGEFIDRIGLDAFKEAVLGDLEGAPTEVKAAEPIVNLPGHGNDPEVEATRLEPGQPITPDTIIRDIVDIYPNTVPVLQSIGMGCLGCPSSTMEPLWQAAEIHGVNVYDLLNKLETARKGA
ncbi:MAG: DUF1858 domain-containing protein [Veillonella sp.]|uniref:DUF1858 domain-containing protein n=1 Tax=Veillonella sp. TaxID=1926307 RepID=UPI002902C6D6|nr:DUF1858 domain-containing protein [Veillonella sp.]MDU2208933.1 DUF1858 domain-containing protein [Veillonella sp.]MDU3705093.1 DUF1858 domain-containing protein [Veillonella sp.]